MVSGSYGPNENEISLFDMYGWLAASIPLKKMIDRCADTRR